MTESQSLLIKEKMPSKVSETVERGSRLCGQEEVAGGPGRVVKPGPGLAPIQPAAPFSSLPWLAAAWNLQPMLTKKPRVLSTCLFASGQCLQTIQWTLGREANCLSRPFL